MIDNFRPAKRRRVAAERPRLQSAVRPPRRTPQKSKVSDNEPVFMPPEEIAALDSDASLIPKTDLPKKNKVPRFSRKKILPRWSRKQWALAAAILVNVLMGGAAWEAMGRRLPQDDGLMPNVSMYYEQKKKPPKTVESRLTGIQISPELNNLPTTSVMLENSPDARPQSGLKEAGVVFEAVSEGGITRFLALYMEAMPEHIGPVRSVRPYFLDFLKPFDAPVAHVGGSAEALAQIRNEGIKDLDQMFNAGAYHRRNHRYAPHNMYTSRVALLELQRSKGWDKSTFLGFLRKTEKEVEEPAVTSIDLKFSGPLYNVHYDYDPAANSYNRVMGGRPHTDEQSGSQLQAKVVIALVVPHSYAGIYSVYQINGSGTAYIFQDGQVTQGIWEKTSRSEQIRFGNEHGSPFAINPGQTWITLVGDKSMVSFR